MIKVALWLVKVALWVLGGQSGALVDQSGALGGQSGTLADQSGALVDQSGTLVDQSGTLVWSKWRFDVMQAHFGWTLKNDSSSLANSETKAPSKCLSKCRPLKVFKAFKNVTSQVSAQWRTQAPAHICHSTPKMLPPKCPKHTLVCAHICHPSPPRQNSCL